MIAGIPEKNYIAFTLNIGGKPHVYLASELRHRLIKAAIEAHQGSIEEEYEGSFEDMQGTYLELRVKHGIHSTMESQR
jgi:hypothetical protein